MERGQLSVCAEWVVEDLEPEAPDPRTDCLVRPGVNGTAPAFTQPAAIDALMAESRRMHLPSLGGSRLRRRGRLKG